MRKETIGLDCAAPEDLLGVRVGVEPGIPVDAIGVACDRAMAVLYLLSGQFMGPAEQAGRYSDAIIFNAITDVQGTIENIRALALHGQRTTEPAKPVGGEQ
ncbi:hypothetical protein [Ectopseudomonas oleovorans]|uniref:hypothetical protein n=1 Tax=Ectopseudomonas oleovorans TaxID=301 RepID=UPI0019CF4E77|nr:hypothetical protein [Pseudomonas oleovorans]MBN7117572.1 hypothetical protein [Pseudomonas oleovorans]MBN7131277.1 hypothetical protein [Pseudomonas oleovorans]MBN7140721.1 hypothetical protein [Pseudomonas oleovorans]